MACFWLVFGAPECLLGGVLASAKQISSIKTAFPSFDTLCFLPFVVVVVVVVVVVAAAAAVVVAVVVE